VLSTRLLTKAAARNNTNSGGFEKLKGVPASRLLRVIYDTLEHDAPNFEAISKGASTYQVPGSFPAAFAASIAAGGNFTEGKAYLVEGEM
jgi:hypothetical protein